jgi:hypothetical protein
MIKMKTVVFNSKYVAALVGVGFALLALNAEARGFEFLNSGDKERVEAISAALYHDEEKEQIKFEEITIEVEEVATVSFINKKGEVVAIMKGEPSVLDDIYQARISRSYLLTTYGIHKVYLYR